MKNASFRSLTLTMPLGVAAVALIAANAAWACSLAPPSLQGMTAPESDRIQLPANTRLLIQAGQGRSARVEITEEESEAVFTASLDKWSTFQLVDLSAFAAPNQTYTVRFWGQADGFADERRPGTEDEEVRPAVRMTLGEDDDVTSPTHDGAMGVPETAFRPGTDEFGPCGGIDSDQYSILVEAPPSSDDFGVAGHRLLVIDDNGGETAVAATLYEDGVLYHSVTEPLVVTYAIETFDFAGNAVRTANIDIDYATAPRKTGFTTFTSGGCSAATLPRTTGVFGALSLGMLALALRRRPSRRD